MARLMPPAIAAGIPINEMTARMMPTTAPTCASSPMKNVRAGFFTNAT